MLTLRHMIRMLARRIITSLVPLLSLSGLLALAGCAFRKAKIVHPKELAGKWVHRRTDGSWGDTVTYLPGGGIVGSPHYTVAPRAHWSVVQSRFGEGLCVVDAGKAHCGPYRIVGDTLVLGNMSNASYFRRAP